MLAKTLKARLGKVLMASRTWEKMRIWEQFSSFVASGREMLAKLARSSYAVRVSAIALLLPLMP